MNQLKLKQISPYGAGNGSLILFDGNKLAWSNQVTSGLALPSGTTVQRPSGPAQGTIRYNSSTTFYEVWNGSAWANLWAAPDGAKGNASFTQLNDVPTSYTGQAGSMLVVNSSATGLTFSTPPTGINRTRIYVTFNSSNLVSSWASCTANNANGKGPGGWTLNSTAIAGSGATANVGTIVGGVIQNNVVLLNGGSGYTNGAIVTISGDGYGATGTATISNGVVTGINITNGGSGYTNAVIYISGIGIIATPTPAVAIGHNMGHNPYIVNFYGAPSLSPTTMILTVLGVKGASIAVNYSTTNSIINMSNMTRTNTNSSDCAYGYLDIYF